VAQRFIDRTQPSLEAQLTNLADEIAYNSHDIDDGLRSGLITIEQLEQVDFFARCGAMCSRLSRPVGPRDLRNPAPPDHGAGRRLDRHLERAHCRGRAKHIDDVRAPAADPFLGRDAQGCDRAQALPVRQPVPPLQGQPHARESQPHRARIVRGLHGRACLLPPDYQDKSGDVNKVARKIADYIAGMTDRYAIREHRRLFSLDEL
jgi:dGTPase